MSTSRLITISREVQEFLESEGMLSPAENFYNALEEAIESAEEEISDFEDEIYDLRKEANMLNRKIYRLEDEVENLQSDLEDIKESSEKYYNSLDDELKQEWWEDVREKYTLAQLEAILGNRFNLKDI